MIEEIFSPQNLTKTFTYILQDIIGQSLNLEKEFSYKISGRVMHLFLCLFYKKLVTQKIGFVFDTKEPSITNR